MMPIMPDPCWEYNCGNCEHVTQIASVVQNYIFKCQQVLLQGRFDALYCVLGHAWPMALLPTTHSVHEKPSSAKPCSTACSQTSAFHLTEEQSSKLLAHMPMVACPSQAVSGRPQ
jgi:hypothetical protein